MSSADPWKEHADFQVANLLLGSKGARFRKIDFHFHTPAGGKDYRDGSATYDQIAKRLQEEGFDAVFVTDHNTWEGIKPLQEACQRVGAATVIFPGIELTLTT